MSNSISKLSGRLQDGLKGNWGFNPLIRDKVK